MGKSNLIYSLANKLKFDVVEINSCSDCFLELSNDNNNNNNNLIEIQNNNINNNEKQKRTLILFDEI